MRAYLMGLFVDVQGRARRMNEELRKASYQSAVPAFFINDTLTMLDRINTDIEWVIQDKKQLFHSLLILGLPIANKMMGDYYAGYVTHYTSLYQALQRIQFRYNVIIRYGKPEIEFSQFLDRIYGEIGLSKPLPIVSLIRNAQDYYCAYCRDWVIGAPLEEENHLLNWPDLYHEIAHFVYDEHKQFLLGDGMIVKYVKDHFATQVEKAEASQKAYWQFWQTHWLKHWLMEFCCDLIATYLTGRAYAWSNFRLSSIIPSDENHQPKSHIYSYQPTHPPNEARMRAIFKMLSRCGWQEKELIELRTDWDTHTSLIMNDEKPDNYSDLIPDDLIDLLVDCVFTECPNIKLKSYHDQLQDEPIPAPISHLLDIAWQRLYNQNETYSVWESEQVTKLRSFNIPTSGHKET